MSSPCSGVVHFCLIIPKFHRLLDPPFTVQHHRLQKFHFQKSQSTHFLIFSVRTDAFSASRVSLFLIGSADSLNVSLFPPNRPHKSIGRDLQLRLRVDTDVIILSVSFQQFLVCSDFIDCNNLYMMVSSSWQSGSWHEPVLLGTAQSYCLDK